MCFRDQIKHQRRSTQRAVLNTISVPFAGDFFKGRCRLQATWRRGRCAGTQAFCQRSRSLASLSASCRTQAKGCRGNTCLHVKVPAMKAQLCNLLNLREACAWQHQLGTKLFLYQQHLSLKQALALHVNVQVKLLLQWHSLAIKQHNLWQQPVQD